MRRVTVVATVVAAGLMGASPAGAGISGPTVSLGSAGGFEYLKASFPSVVSQAGAPAECDGGETVTGGGGTIGGNGANAALNATYPTSFEGDGWKAEASTSAPGGRTVTTYAICGEAEQTFSNANGLLDPAGGGFDAGSQTQGCVPESGEQALFGVQGTGGDVRILELRPAFDGLNWSTSVQNLADEGAQFTAWYGCDATLDPAVVQSDVMTVKPGEAGKATARCKRSEAVIGGGVFSAISNDPRRETWATSTRPYDSKDRKKTPDDGWSVKVQNGRESGKTKIAAYALCQGRKA